MKQYILDIFLFLKKKKINPKVSQKIGHRHKEFSSQADSL